MTFMPMTVREDGEAGPYSNGETDAEGKFTLVTAEQRERRGAVVGKHRVIVSTKKAHLDPNDRDREIVDSPEILPRIYYDYRQTTLEVEIPEGGTETIELSLDSKAGR
ncbi:hypothetical protein [Aeoliella sp.]|uniref:hypothetical protein n=1 Tax=Aeoliella sp. TaxID=2795800 RepID=UPI003CCBEE24